MGRLFIIIFLQSLNEYRESIYSFLNLFIFCCLLFQRPLYFILTDNLQRQSVPRKMEAELCSKRDRDEDQDDELTIPRAAMNKMIKELLPNIRVANEARELVLNCCTEFIHLISSESNEICNGQQKKTISAEHVLAALEKLGFGDFKKDAEEVSLGLGVHYNTFSYDIHFAPPLAGSPRM